MLRSVFLHWQDWNKAVIDIRSIFSYLDRTYLLRERTLGSINDLTITQFRKMLSSSASKDATNQTPFTRCLHGVCELIAYDRVNDDRFDARLLKESVRMFNVLNVYQKSFEPAFLHDSVNFFHEFADERNAASLKEYILACEKLLKDEDYRCNAYNLDSTTKKQLLDAAHGIVVKDYSAKLLDVESLSKLLADHEIESMRALYDLLRLSGIQAKLKDPWKTYIQEAGATIVGDVERGDDMVMRGDEVFGYELRQAFGAFVNDRKTTSGWSTGTSKIGEMIAKHIDMLLRGGLKALPKSLLSDNKDRAAAEKSGQSSTADEDAELDRQLDAALELFRRLLMGRSASEDAERNMLRKLRDECGANFTRNLEQMFKDQELAKEEMQHYKQWSEGTNAEQQVDLQVMVISAASWPTYPDTKLNLPEGAAVEIERFERCAFQAVVLVLFNEVDLEGFLSFGQISTATGLAGPELQRTLQSLAETDTFTINKAFTDPKLRIKINQIQLKETKEENKATHERIAEDRKFETQAAIVRVMKARKTIGHSELVAEVINFTRKRGPVDAASIKKLIETLIDKDYMERDGNMYTYIS
ncbi:Cullin-4A like protein [Verticillium longisporum]|nr:Cullin-4A like protein [Verticillium longisporum]